jgi:hypothetical protein
VAGEPFGVADRVAKPKRESRTMIVAGMPVGKLGLMI